MSRQYCLLLTNLPITSVHKYLSVYRICGTMKYALKSLNRSHLIFSHRRNVFYKTVVPHIQYTKAGVV